MPSLTLPALLLASLIVFLGGLVKGTAGFGYAIASTALLAVIVSPSTAVVLMILPMLVANLTLLRELEWSELTSCLTRFWPYLVAAMAGTALGMVLLASVPTSLLVGGLGAFTLAYVLVKQPYQVPGEQVITEYCFRSGLAAKTALGFVSGIVFGLSNVAVQVVAYLDSLSLDRSTFVGVLAMILVGISGLRIAFALHLGMYQSGATLLHSAVLSIPGLIGVSLGKQLRNHISETYERGGVLVLLSIIGIRLLWKSFSAL